MDKLDALLRADSAEVRGAFRDLVADLTPGRADEVIPALADALPTAPPQRRPHLVVALGLLADTEDPAVLEALTKRLDGPLEMVADAQRPLLTALLYLLGHFPAQRERVLDAFRGADISPDEASRLDRSLDALDPAAPVIGRVWPSPLAWSLTPEQAAKDAEWARSLPTDVVTAAWREDTGTLHAYAGAKALWDAESGLTPDGEEPEVVPPSAPSAPADAGPARWTRFAEAFRCPACLSALTEADGGASCTGCGTLYSETDGLLQFGSDSTGPSEAMFQAAFTRYERRLRPPVLRLSGSNWDNVLTPADEDAFLAANVSPVDGPVLDVGCGPGRWTAVLAREFGSERVIALDRSPTMLGLVRHSMPDVVRVGSDALNLPFADASVGAVNSWNMLQALPDPAKAVAEMGRVLRPGGTFTLMTYRTSDDPVYAHFQKQLTLTTFDPAELEGWLAGAGLTVRQRTTPGTFLLLTAVRD
ncbi:class I SAM-dependent methyltransferase [Lentzea sp. NPDC060358]|uniref:class I SAM-dependent methyltransferase n=1 Tax=Lentzea sp. NPDC060358 TaxID=3347103 RepID=UPI003651AB88